MRDLFYALAVVLMSAATWNCAPAQVPAATSAGGRQSVSKALPPYESDLKFIAAMAEGKKLIHERQYHFAVDAYKKANKIAGGNCARCLDDIFELQMAMGKYKDAVATASLLEAMAATPIEKSLAEGDRGRALMRGGDKPKPDQLQAAHAALQSALSMFPKNNPARFSDGCVLARMGNMDEASKQFAACAEAAASNDPMKPRARHFAENPALSLSKMAPAFAVTALDGTHFNLDDMGGRVVLIDFWATWCGPCNRELPHLKKIAQEFAGQPLVMISISWDADEAKWKQFIQDHEMRWVQYRDADHSLSTQFGVNAIPHYFTIDSDGVLTAELLGEGTDVESKLKKLIKRANEAKATSTQVAGWLHGEAAGTTHGEAAGTN